LVSFRYIIDVIVSDQSAVKHEAGSSRESLSSFQEIEMHDSSAATRIDVREHVHLASKRRRYREKQFTRISFNVTKDGLIRRETENTARSLHSIKSFLKNFDV
jgi:hypothetical protein